MMVESTHYKGDWVFFPEAHEFHLQTRRTKAISQTQPRL